MLTSDKATGLVRNVTCLGDGTFSSNATKIVDAAMNGSPPTASSLEPVVIFCDSHYWRIELVRVAANPSIFSTSICVDCFNVSFSPPLPLAGYNCDSGYYYLSPCNNLCVSNSAYLADTHGRVLGITYAQFNKAPSISSVKVVAAQRTSLQLQVNVTEQNTAQPGRIYCLAAAAATMSKAPTVAQVRYSSAQAILSRNLTSTIVALTNLIPATNYSVYCVTESLDGVVSSSAAVADSIFTLCCKSVHVNLRSAAVRTDAAHRRATYPGLVQITVDFQPSEGLQLQLAFASRLILDSPILTIARQTITYYDNAPFSPASLLFDGPPLTVKSSEGTARNYSFFPPFQYPQMRAVDFLLSNPERGINYFNVTLAGTAAGEYSLVQSAPSVAIQKFADFSGAPYPIGALVSSDGLLTVKFNVPTDRGGLGLSTKCANIFNMVVSANIASTTKFPTPSPSSVTTAVPTIKSFPTGQPTSQPTTRPTKHKRPTGQPTRRPSAQPSRQPTSSPSLSPTNALRQISISDAVCSWTDDAHVTANIRDLPGISPLTILTIKPRVIRAKCLVNCNRAYDKFAELSTISVVYASIPVTVVLTLPAVASTCDLVYTDLTKSSGSGGRPWLYYDIIVSTASPLANTTGASMWTNLLTRKFDVGTPLLIPAEYMVPGSYIMTATLCNFQSVCSTAAKAFTIVQQSIPRAEIILASRDFITLRPSEVLSLSAKLPRSRCLNVSFSNLAYAWRLQLHSPHANSWIPVVNLATQKNHYILPPFSLAGGNMYSLELTVTNTASLRQSNHAVIVRVADASIIAVIEGPSSVSLSVGRTLTLNASRSYDELGSSANLNYSWTCGNCGLHLKPVHGSGQIVSVTAGAGLAGSLNVVSLTVWTKDRAAVTNVTVAVNADSLPTAFIVKPARNIKINAFDTLTIEASISNVAVLPVTLTWSSDTVNLANVARGPLSQTIYTASVVPRSFTLSIAANSLPPRSSLIFFLGCFGANIASITIVTNGPPTPGNFFVVPMQGFEMSTPFSLIANDWADPDLPLSYEFGVVSHFSIFISLGELSQDNEVNTILPAVANNNDVLRRTFLAVHVYDSLGANSSSLARIKIAEIEKSGALGVLQNFLDETSISIGTANTDVSVLKKVIGMGSSLLNRANCTSAPACAALNRLGCTTTPHTCGPCFNYDAFVGEDGNKNTMCYPVMVGQQRAKSVNASSLSCSSESDCPYFQYCNQTKNLNKCYSPAAACPGGCSGNGQCKFVDILLGQQTTFCGVSNTSCQATCLCYYGFYGSACAYTLPQWKMQQSIRSSLVDKLNILIASEPPYRSSIISWVSSLDDLSAFPEEIYTSKSAVLLGIVQKLITVSAQVGVEPSAVASLGSGISAYIQMVRNPVSLSYSSSRRLSTQLLASNASAVTHAAKVIQLAQSYVDLVASGLVADQNGTGQIGTYFRFYAKKLSVGSLLLSKGGVMLSGPSSTLERAQGKSPLQLTLGDLGAYSTQLASQAASTFSVTVVAVSAAMFANGALSSDVTRINFNAMPCPAATGCVYTVSVPSRELVDLTRQNYGPGVGIFSVFCHYGSTKETSFQCPNGDTVRAKCNRTEGTIVLDCPHYFSSSKCNTFSLSSNTLATESTCKAVQQTFSQLRCSCVLGGGGGGSGGGVSLVSASTSIVSTVTVARFGLGTSFKPLVLNFVTSRDWALAYCLSGIGGFFLLFGLVSYTATILGKDKKKLNKQREEDGHFGSWSWAILTVDRCLPSMLREGHLSARMWTEVKDNHRWLRIIFSGGSSGPTTNVHSRILALGMHVFLPLFVVIAMYNFIDADDGTCEAIRLVDQCEHDKSLLAVGLAPSASRCSWQNNICVPRHPSDWTTLIQVSVFAAIAAAPLASAAEYVFIRILGAKPLPTIIHRTTAVARPLSLSPTRILPYPGASGESVPDSEKRRLPNIPSGCLFEFSGFTIAGKTNEQIAEALSKALLTHARHLPSQNKKLLFWEAWGLDPPGAGTVTRMAIHHANQVRSVVNRAQLEQHKMENFCTSKRAKSSRLLYFLVRDFLTSEVHQRILDLSDFRRSGNISGTEREIGWAYMALLFSGVSFALYLFFHQSNLSSSRQQCCLWSYAALLGIEVVFSSNANIYMCHYLVPYTITHDLGIAKQHAVEVLHNAQMEGTEETEGTEAFNAASIFFVSAHLAQFNSAVSMSEIVKSYSTPKPPPRIANDVRWVNRAMSMLLRPHVVFHDMAINALAQACGGYSLLGFMALYKIQPFFVILPVLFCAAATHFLVTTGKAKVLRRLQLLQQLPPQPSAGSATSRLHEEKKPRGHFGPTPATPPFDENSLDGSLGSVSGNESMDSLAREALDVRPAELPSLPRNNYHSEDESSDEEASRRRERRWSRRASRR